MLVLDTSAALEALVAEKPNSDLLSRLAGDPDLHAPHLIDVEVLHALRGLVRGGAISADQAMDARRDFADLTIVRYGHFPLADRIWELRDNVGAYDAVFAALAEQLGVPLVTCDAKLARAPGSAATIELFPADSR